ncbi:hypothetical protein K474DRAFT_1664824 [Panus rudis PR-1116 ss-1]|nr:hypothetical protein K474DRAFT_1664824 [Panus rudis PR-1116 ss-1]
MDSGPRPTPPQTFLDLVDACDNYTVPKYADEFKDEVLAPWHLAPVASSPVVGLIRPCVVAQLKLETTGLWTFFSLGGRERVSFSAVLDTPAKRTQAMKELCERWRDQGLWPAQIGPKKWRAEMYPIYRNPFGKHDAPVAEKGEEETGDDSTNYAFMMERSAAALFGVVTYGVHMTVYHGSIEEQNCKIWVPTRARTKQTWPGYLDNSVAGGIPSGYGIFESLVKESMEEASIPEDIVRNYAKSVGVISYFYRTKAGWLQPEVEYAYHICIPDGFEFQPKPLDGEVEAFELLELSEVISKLRAGLFKANCALVLIDFLINQGYITPDNEPDYLEIVTRMHGRFDYEHW